jgi:type II restriction enzyme
LRDLGSALGFAVWIAGNDRNRPYAAGRLADGCLDSLPETLANAPGAESMRLIDVLWIEPATGRVAAAFEVEHTTSIYSGIVCMLDLALGLPEQPSHALFLVAPDARETEVGNQLRRPVFSRIADLHVRCLPYSELEAHRESSALRFRHERHRGHFQAGDLTWDAARPISANSSAAWL